MDCHLHGICQARLYPVANQMSAPAPPPTGLEIGQPCSPTCYLHANRAAAGGNERLAHGVPSLSERQARRGEAGKEQQDEVGGQMEKRAEAEGAVERGVARQAGGGGSEQAGQSGGVDEGGGGQGAREAGGVSSSGDAQSMTVEGRAREGGAKEVRGFRNLRQLREEGWTRVKEASQEAFSDLTERRTHGMQPSTKQLEQKLWKVGGRTKAPRYRGLCFR
jgi:hypothetical protein